MSTDPKIDKSLIEIICYIINGDAEMGEIVVNDWGKLVHISKKNGIFQYVYRYMKQLPEEKKPSDNIVSYMEKLNSVEIQTGVVQEYTVETLNQGFEEAGIDHMFIKGTVTKKRYPDSFLRSMGDIDFLYNASQDDLLCKKMSEMEFEKRTAGRVHDIYVNNNIFAEAHRQLLTSSSPYYMLFDNIWNNAEKAEDTEHTYSMKLEDEFLFNFIHLVSHFKKGGIGIRFIIDVWIYKRLDLNWEYINTKLAEFNLLKFYELIDLLSEKWFGNRDTDDPTVSEIERYVLSGNIFGNSENRINSAVRNGKVKYFLRVCFPSYKEMQSMFPTLKHKAMLPVAWVRRGFDSLTKRRENIKALMQPMKTGNAASATEMKQFYKKCGLE